MIFLQRQVFLLLCILGLSQMSIGQINYAQPFDGCNADPCNNWDWNVASGNITAVAALGYTPCAVANPAARANLSGAILTANFTGTTTLGTSSGEFANFGFSYKVINITTGAATPPNSCTFTVQYANAVGGPWTTVETFQNISSTACTPYVSTRFFPPAGQQIFMRVMATRNSGDFWAVIDDISLTQPPPSQILTTNCSCNNDQTPNMTDGTFTTALRINYNPAQSMASGLVYTLTSSIGITNMAGGPIGTPTFMQCSGGGCPPGIMNGEYYLPVRVQSNGMYSAMVDGPDPNGTSDLILGNSTCNVTYPALLTIPIDDVVCITSDTMFASNGGIYNSLNLLDPINLRVGFSQTGTGPLMVNYDDFDPTNHNPYNIYLIAQNGGCRSTSYKEVGIYRRPITNISDRYYGCREIGRTINLFEMFDTGTFGGGTFYLDGVTEVPSGSYNITGSACQSVTYRIDDPNCGIIESTATFRLDVLPTPSFELVADRVSPICLDGGSVSVTINRTSTGPNPSLTINGVAVTGTTFNLDAPTSQGSITYQICLTESTSVIANGCNVTLPANAEGCVTEFCRRYTIYNDGFGCGANALFDSQCEVPVRDVCEAEANPRLTLACGSIFSIEIPYDILTTRITMSQDVIDCTDEEVCGNFNASLFGIDVPGGGGPRVEDIPGIGSLCDFFDTCLDLGFFEICPFSFLYDILMCDRSILSIIFDALAAVVGGDGGDWILVADTDGDGSFDYMVEPGDGTNAASGFPSNGDFCIPNNMSGAGTITVRLVAGWPNKPTATCGPIVSDGINLLDLLPLGAIPIAGPIIEDILAAAGCNVELAFSNYTDSQISVFNNNPPTFAGCNESGYVFQQELSCNIPVNWSVPSAIIPCEMTTLTYAGVTVGADLSFYQGADAPTPIDEIIEEGIYQTAGPIPGSILPPGVYPVTYTAVSCNGNPSQCTFNVVVTQDVPELVCPNDLTVNTNVGQCTAFLNGLAPYRGLGGCSSILNYSYTDPVSGTINETTDTDPGSINIPDGHRFELGETVVTYTLLNDNNGDGDYLDDNETQVCTFSITVQDLEKPHAVCIDSELILDNEGSGTVFADIVANGVFIDGGSDDNCDELELTISMDGVTWTESIDFSCSDEGPNYLQLRAVDGSGNESFCFAIINVRDFFTDFVLNLDVPEVCFEPFQNTYDFSPYLVIATPDDTNIRHSDVGTLGPQIIGSFGISGFLPDPGSSFDPGVITPDGVYTLGSGTGWITISYVLAIEGQINEIDGEPLQGCFRMVHDIFRGQKLDPIWNGGFMCCDQLPVWLGGANWDGNGMPPIPAGMISLTAIRGSYPGDVYGEWTGEGVTFQNPDGVFFLEMNFPI
ncbi:MAG: hypothetical protein IPN86_02975 [Saprospiraceae bacterium]|nr:hypothetical protein [Saprospiraceae bacterium]